jgi:hypothetical protein
MPDSPFVAYPQWNPWIVAVQGEPVVNAAPCITALRLPAL